MEDAAVPVEDLTALRSPVLGQKKERHCGLAGLRVGWEEVGAQGLLGLYLALTPIGGTLSLPCLAEKRPCLGTEANYRAPEVMET